MNERMKCFQNSHDSNTMDSSYDEISCVLYELAIVLPEEKSTNWFKMERYLLHKQFKAG